MTAEQWRQVKGLLEECLEQPEGTRTRFLRSRCEDPELQSEVKALLDAYRESAEFLEKPVEAGAGLADALGPESALGQVVGHYRLVEEIGRGGMGIVYRAVRADDEFDIEVAIKIVSRGMDTEMLLRRFRNERQILANLDHPYIARLLDGGTTDTGLPYFVMEYVAGTPLNEYCDSHRLNIIERLHLFRKVCEAVSYAHQNLVVHRDLKPANILVTADGTPKLLDFGIARLLSSDDTPGSEQTMTMMRMATPAYASPEQIRGKAASVGSDVYSLGVILYELLTGHRPYRLPSREAIDMAQIICEREPTRASQVIGYTESEEHGQKLEIIDPERICAARNTQLATLKRKLQGDLETILEVALRKDPHRRYKSVEQFSADIRRYLANLPIGARRETLRYRAAKFLTRNKAGVIASGTVTVMLLASTLFALQKADKLSHRIEEDQRLATNFLTGVHDSIATLPGATPAREAMLRHALEYLNGLARDAGEDSSYRRSLALAYERFADLQAGIRSGGLERPNDALETIRKARRIRESLAGANPEDDHLQLELASNHLLEAFITGRAGKAQERTHLDERALKIANRLIAKDTRNKEYRSLLARAHISAAYGLMLEDKWEPMRRHLEQALAVRTEIAAEDPNNLPAKREVAQIHYRLGVAYVQEGRFAEAAWAMEEALQTQRLLVERRPEHLGYRSELASSLHFLGISLGELGKNQEGLPLLTEAIEFRRQAMAKDERDLRLRSFLAGNLSARAKLLLALNRREAALADAAEAVKLQDEVLMADPRAVPNRISMAKYLAQLGQVLAASAQVTGAAQAYHRAASYYSTLHSEGHLRSPLLITEAVATRRMAERYSTPEHPGS
jgi:non-specific serine/threonine protein kinase/serine/threonine-protein kinase